MRQKALPFLEAKLLCTRCTVTVLAPLLGLRYAQQVMSPTGRYAALPQGCMILKHARTYRYLDTYAYAPHPTHGPMAAAASACHGVLLLAGLPQSSLQALSQTLLLFAADFEGSSVTSACKTARVLTESMSPCQVKNRNSVQKHFFPPVPQKTV